MSKAKLLLCHNYYQEAGGESIVFDNELQGLAARGHAVVTYTRDNSEIEEMGALAKASLVPRTSRSAPGASSPGSSSENVPTRPSCRTSSR